MATATKKSRASRQVPRHAAVVSESAAITPSCFRTTAAIAGRSSVPTARASRTPVRTPREEAAHAVRVVRDGACAARFEAGAALDRPVGLVARRSAAAARADSDSLQGLDEGGSFSSEAVTQWPAER